MAEPIYVTVYVRVNPLGKSVPVMIEWEDGRRFVIDKICKLDYFPPKHQGGYMLERYDCLICGQRRFLFHETFMKQWYVLPKE